MANDFEIFPPGTPIGRRGYPTPAGNGNGNAELAQARRQLEKQAEILDALNDQPLSVATVVELRGDRMTISFGPGGTFDINAIADCKVGNRVRCNRNTMQAIDTIKDPIPVGVIVTAQRQTGNMVEAELNNVLRTFRSPTQIAKGERVIVDPSFSFVIGTLGMPPQTFAFAPKVSVSWDDIGGHVAAKAALREAIELPFTHPELFAAYGKRAVRGVLLHGPSGTGKTLLAKASATSIAKARGLNATESFVYVKGPELLNSYIGKTEEGIRTLFAGARTQFAKTKCPVVIFLDECDALLGIREQGSKISLNATIVPQFLAEMDGLDDQATMLILATNRPDMLDPAIVREGRIDRRVLVGRPTLEDAEAIFKIYLRARPLTQGEDAEQAAILLAMALFDDKRVLRDLGEHGAVRLRSFASGAMIAGIVEQASTQAMMRDIGVNNGVAGGVSIDDLYWAIDQAQMQLANVSHAEVIQELLEGKKA